MNFENMVARYRKTSEMVAELKEYAQTLAAERDALESEIIAHCAQHGEVYNVFERKTSSAGIAGRNMFTVTFSEQLERTSSGGRLDDKEWLDGLFQKCPFVWTESRRLLLTSKVLADIKSGLVDAAQLKGYGMRLGRRAHVTAKRIPDDAELSALRSAAEAMVEDLTD